MNAGRTARARFHPSRSTAAPWASRPPADSSIAAVPFPNLYGRYVFADFATGNVWHIARDTAPTLTLGATSPAFNSGLQVSSFAQDADGELYVVHLGGTLHKLVQAAGGGRTIPTQLSQTGCVASNPTQPASGLIPYAPNAPFFSDNAEKTRWLALPDGQRITVDGNNDFAFPNGSVLVKNFALGGQLVETRLFMRHNDGNWAGYTYEWNAQQTEATRVVGGKTVQVGSQTWEFPSEAQCLSCHSLAAGRTLGLEIGQLNGNFAYQATGRTANQLTTLNTIDTLTPALAQTPDQLPLIPDPFGTAPLAQRARAYLHTNCSHCHRNGGPAQGDLDLRLHPGSERDQCLRHHPHLRRPGNHGFTADCAGFGGALGDRRAHQPHGRGCHAAAGAAHHRHRGSATHLRLGERPCELQLRAIFCRGTRTARQRSIAVLSC